MRRILTGWLLALPLGVFAQTLSEVPPLKPPTGGAAGAASSAGGGTGAQAPVQLSAPLGGSLALPPSLPQAAIQPPAASVARPEAISGAAPAKPPSIGPAPAGNIQGPAPRAVVGTPASPRTAETATPLAESPLPQAAREKSPGETPAALQGAELPGSAAGNVSGLFDGSRPLPAADVRVPEARGPPSRSDPLDADAQAAARYIRSIMGSQKPTAAQAKALLLQFLEDHDIDPDSPRALAIEARLLPAQAKERSESLSKVDPRLRHFGGLILQLSSEYKTTPQRVEALIAKHRLEGLMAGLKDKGRLEHVLRTILEREEVEKVVSRYPRNAQGDFLRGVGDNLLAKSGKSIEEISRAGVFGYASFSGRAVTRAVSGRDPDDKSPDIVFYIELAGGRWKIGGYRQNRPRGVSDAEYLSAFQDWLVSGGIPPSDFSPR